MLVQMDNVEKKYNRFELKCSLKVREGYVTGVIGQNGAGKTTAFKALLGLIKADGGKLQIFGKEPDKLTDKDREKIGVVLSDSGYSDYFRLKDVVKIMKGFYPDFHADQFMNKCREYGLPEDKTLKSFSSGMKAKLKLLTALCQGADLLILDEPTSGLDVVARDDILDMLREFMEDEDRGILVSSHISSDLEGICDDIYMIHDGKVILHEDTDVILDQYGILKVPSDVYTRLDKSYIKSIKKESFGYQCLTNQRQYYLKNEPDIVNEKGTIDDVIMMMVKGEAV